MVFQHVSCSACVRALCTVVFCSHKIQFDIVRDFPPDMFLFAQYVAGLAEIQDV